ncbi:MAG: pilus assembly protein [Candidatus Aureabacteria bacterium]|nr:pilus assembly protein [Candidatus Auribacterota bacterium]
MKRFFNSAHGSAMAEFVYVMPIMGILFLAMYQLYLLCDAKHRVIQSSRYAAFGKAYSKSYDKTSHADLQSVIENNILGNNEPEYQGVLTLKNLEINSKDSYKASSSGNGIMFGNYLDPLTILSLKAYGHAIDGDLDNKYECRVVCDFKLNYLYHINELTKILGRDEMVIPPITLVDSLVVIGNDWSSKTKKEFAGRVGVPSSKTHYISPDKGLWLYPLGGTIGAVFTTINSIFGTICDMIGWLFSGVADPIDPRGDYFNDDNSHSPDYVH